MTAILFTVVQWLEVHEHNGALHAEHASLGSGKLGFIEESTIVRVP